MPSDLFDSHLSRREIMAAGAGAALIGIAPQSLAATAPAKTFPKGFLWGTSTAGHQIEGNDTNSDAWAAEWTKPSSFVEPAGDACDGYHRFREDIALIKAFGLNAYRFSVEWSRIEPEPGFFSMAELDHYKAVAEECRRQGIMPLVTYWHWAVPRWFGERGGWYAPDGPKLFARFCERVTRHMGDLIGAAVPLNEPNVTVLTNWPGPTPSTATFKPGEEQPFFLSAHPLRLQPGLLEGHRLAYQAIKAGPGDFPVGVSMAMTEDDAVNPADTSGRDAKRKAAYGAWMKAASQSDFVGLQVYTRTVVDGQRILPPPKGAELTQMNYEFWPQSLEASVRYTASQVKVPIYITENGIGTADDTRRIAYIDQALAGLHRAMVDGIDVRGYFHWSLLDNFEWVLGYRMTFGLVAVDRTTFKRTPKPSAWHYGAIAKRNRL